MLYNCMFILSSIKDRTSTSSYFVKKIIFRLSDFIILPEYKFDTKINAKIRFKSYI